MKSSRPVASDHVYPGSTAGSCCKRKNRRNSGRVSHSVWGDDSQTLLPVGSGVAAAPKAAPLLARRAADPSTVPTTLLQVAGEALERPLPLLAQIQVSHVPKELTSQALHA